jgi:hypothetical protein
MSSTSDAQGRVLVDGHPRASPDVARSNNANPKHSQLGDPVAIENNSTGQPTEVDLHLMQPAPGTGPGVLCGAASEWDLDLSVLGIELTDELLAWAEGRADRDFRRRGPRES